MRVQVAPFQCSKNGRLNAPPTAKQLVVLAHAMSVRDENSAFGWGTDTVDHLVPSQCSTNEVNWAVPTAKQLVTLGHAAAARVVFAPPAGLSLGITDQVAAAPAGAGTTSTPATSIVATTIEHVVFISPPDRRSRPPASSDTLCLRVSRRRRNACLTVSRARRTGLEANVHILFTRFWTNDLPGSGSRARCSHRSEPCLPRRACTQGVCRPSDTIPEYTRSCGHVDSAILVVREVDAELVVDGSLVLWVGVGECADDVLQLAYGGF